MRVSGTDLLPICHFSLSLSLCRCCVATCCVLPVTWIAELPKNASGKVLKRELRDGARDKDKDKDKGDGKKGGAE